MALGVVVARPASGSRSEIAGCGGPSGGGMASPGSSASLGRRGCPRRCARGATLQWPQATGSGPWPCSRRLPTSCSRRCGARRIPRWCRAGGAGAGAQGRVREARGRVGPSAVASAALALAPCRRTVYDDGQEPGQARCRPSAEECAGSGVVEQRPPGTPPLPRPCVHRRDARRLRERKAGPGCCAHRHGSSVTSAMPTRTMLPARGRRLHGCRCLRSWTRWSVRA